MIPMFSIRTIQDKAIEKRESDLDTILFEQQVIEQSEPQKITLPKPAVNFKSIRLLKKELELENHPFFKGSKEKVVAWINNCVIVVQEEERDNITQPRFSEWYKVNRVFYFYHTDYGIRTKSLGRFYPEPRYWMKGFMFDEYKKSLPELRDYILKLLHENNIPIRSRKGSII
jgi:hypothetical protein